MKIGFALITKEPFFDEIVQVENTVHDICRFNNKLELTENIPHTTLFQGSFKDDTDYSLIVNNIRDFFVDNIIDHNLHFEQAVYVPHGWYFYTCKNTEDLRLLHAYTLGQCKDHIILEKDRLKEDMSDLTEAQILGIKKFGYRYTGKAFFPHITIGRNDDDKSEAILKILNDRLSKLEANVPIEKITVYRMGKDGMHEGTLAEISI